MLAKRGGKVFDAIEARGEGNVGHGQIGVSQEHLGLLKADRL